MGKINKDITNTIQFISENEIEQEILEAQASISNNPYIRWAKFILTDDQPNGNNERTPLSEFDNIIATGIHMPIKMGEGMIEEGHEDASPIGVITHLKKEFMDGVNRIVGLAALWLRERPSDVTFLKSKVDSNEDVNISWELGASEKVPAPDGVFDWKGLAVQAATVVSKPAYQGRTRIIAIAAKKKEPKWTAQYIENLPDSSFLYIERGGEKDSEGRTQPTSLRYLPVRDDKGLYDKSKLEEALTEAGKLNVPTSVLKSVKATVTALLDKIDGGASLEEISGITDAPLGNIQTEEDNVEDEKLTQRVAELEAQLATALASLKEKEDALTDAKASQDAVMTELEELRTYKKTIDDEVAKAEKLDTIKTKFAEASIQKDEAYFVENSEKLLSLDEASFDFMLQEISAFAKIDGKASLEGDDKKGAVPNLPGEAPVITVSEIVKALKERKSK